MFFLQEAPANTTGYMLSGYAVIFGVILLYIISLYVRRKNYQKDIELLQELENRE
jgi:hypothetical protein